MTDAVNTPESADGGGESPQESRSRLPGASETLELLFSPDYGPFTNPQTGFMALGDWNRGFAKSLAALTKRALHAGGGPTALRREGAPTAIILPGWLREWETVEPWGRALHAVGWDVRFVPELDRQPGSLQDLAETLLNFLVEEQLDQVVVVAHSKGGLVTKWAMTMAGGDRISLLIAVGTPFEGAPLAQVLPSEAGGDSLRPDNTELSLLEKRTDVNNRIFALEAKRDQNVPSLENLPGARIIRTEVEGHTALLDAPEVLAWIVTIAASAPSAPDPLRNRAG